MLERFETKVRFSVQAKYIFPEVLYTDPKGTIWAFEIARKNLKHMILNRVLVLCRRLLKKTWRNLNEV